MKQPYFTVYYEANERVGWRYTLWAANGAQLAESATHYSSKSNARAGCYALMRCFRLADDLEIFNIE